MNFCDRQRFWRKTALLRPKITRTDLQSPRKTALVRRLTVNRKPLSTASRLHFHRNSPEFSTAVLAEEAGQDEEKTSAKLPDISNKNRFSAEVNRRSQDWLGIRRP